jgi:D-alanyl-D-alanine carboxypeptidase
MVTAALWGDDAAARRHSQATTSYSPAYAAIVIDANSGNVMHSSNADALRHPASLTKIMTLYLLFERLEAGKLKLDSPLKVSEHAAGQDPTKLGLKEGSSILVEDAIKGIITRSANDAAVVVAENIANSEDEFAEMMTRKARTLGMTKTVYRNASGLPDDEQVTTARDQSILGRAIQERFPRSYKFFQIRSFTFRGQTISNHNRLLGRVDGVDGIKTGYTRASGFNLVTSLHRDGRYVVAVVLGGTSAGSRDARMRELLEEHVNGASMKRSAPVIAEASPAQAPIVQAGHVLATKGAQRATVTEETPKTDVKEPQRVSLASAANIPARLDQPTVPAVQPLQATPGSSDPIRPVMVKTLNVKASAPVQTAAAVPIPFPTWARTAEPAPLAHPKTELPKAELHKTELPRAEPRPEPRPAASLPAPAPATAAKVTAAQVPAAQVPATQVTTPPQAASYTAITVPATAFGPAETATVVRLPAQPASVPAQVASVPAQVAGTPAMTGVTPSKALARTGWIIQVGAYPEESIARQQLTSVKNKAARLLAKADAFTESVLRGDTTYFRARFAGLDKDQAEAACKYLKRNDVDCVAIKN